MDLNPRSANDANDANDVLHTSISTGALDYFDVDKVEIVNVHPARGFPRCDINIGRKWKASYGDVPLLGANGELGNPYKVGRDGTLEEVLAKYDEWLWHGT